MRIMTLITLLLTAQVASANVIFHAFTMPYIAPLFFLPMVDGIVGILLLESWLLWFLGDKLNVWQAILIVIVTNMVSWWFGFCFSTLFPSGLERIDETGPLTTGDDFGFLMYISFPVAYVLTMLIEGGCFWLADRFVPAISISQPFVQSLRINTVSYGLIFAVFLYHF